MIAWQTRTICQYISITIEIPKGKENKAYQMATEITLDKEEQQQQEVPNEIYETPEENLAANDAANRNQRGSFESLMRGFSGPQS